MRLEVFHKLPLNELRQQLIAALRLIYQTKINATQFLESSLNPKHILTGTLNNYT